MIILFWSGLPYGVALLIISPAIILYLSVFSWIYGLIAIVIITAGGIFITTIKMAYHCFCNYGVCNSGRCTIGINKNTPTTSSCSSNVAFTNPSYDPTGAGWNVIQAKTAIGSGGWTGKGFLEGTQTQLRFLPEQWTDFIFCVVGEKVWFLRRFYTHLSFRMLFLLRFISIID